MLIGSTANVFVDNAMTDQLIDNLPQHLAERSRIVQKKDSDFAGAFVLYWLRTAVRADENPALDVAIEIANERGLPLLVYHAISQHYAFASDRHHTFMLEGARDVQQQFRDRDISYAFHLATVDDHAPHLVELAEEAALVVTEEMPVDPPRRFLEALCRHVDTTILSVDTACVVPMNLIGKAYTRAFKFRDKTKRLYAERLTRAWPQSGKTPQPFDLSQLPFKSIDLQTASLAKLVSCCEIDHSIGPVVDTRGGSDAGYDRWTQFREKGLARYAKTRNNALLDGVSRMSAYLHYGMVSPFRIAREAAQTSNGGSEKYLDELLIWREMAYAFCFHREDHDQWTAIPDWAQQTLEDHASDNREDVYSWEQLARAQTNDSFWNAAQMSLLRQGELHNNVRMTWGKAILNWVRCPKTALRMMIDLNHRYALDGRDPASYGGLLWCVGQFDRPFSPETNIFGSVRPRYTSDHARRLNVEQFANRVATVRFDPAVKVAVIGAGISGLFAARTLVDHGLEVQVFDKGRGVGGRMSTRRVDGVARFDHGAQYFTARDPNFKRYLDSWIEQGVAAPWPDLQRDASEQIVTFKNGEKTVSDKTHDRYVGTPGMNSICKHLAAGIDVTTSTLVKRIEASERGIRLLDDSGTRLGTFDRVVVSAPAEQSSKLLSEFPALSNEIAKIRMNPCWAVMVSFADRLTDDWSGAFIHESVLTWVARNSSKPNRSQGEDWVLHFDHMWSADHWKRDPTEVIEIALDAFWKSTGIDRQEVVDSQAHRWKFAIPENPAEARCFFDSDAGIAACGDWAGGPRVEGAFLSGMAAAGRILSTLTPKTIAMSEQQTFGF